MREIYLSKIAGSARCTLVLHANVTEIRLEENFHRVATVEASSLSGKKVTVRARAFVLCAGGIETARCSGE